MPKPTWLLIAMFLFGAARCTIATALADEPASCVEHGRYALRFASDFRYGLSPDWLDRYSWGHTNPGARDDAFYGQTSLPGGKTFATRYAGSGVLHLRAFPAETMHSDGAHYFSGLVNSLPFLQQQYGLFEARIRTPVGRGLWPAFWMLTHDGTKSEIDVMERLGNDPNTVYHTLWGPDGQKHTARYRLPDDPNGYHTYAVAWDPERVTYIVDGVKTAQFPNMIKAPMHLIINLQVGGPGSWPGVPDASTEFPAVLDVSAIHVYRYIGRC